MAEKRYRNRTTSICEIEVKDEYRFCYGVYNLVNLRKEKFEPGKSYHILSDGKVDMLNHLRWLIMLYGRIEHVCISSWSISATNILLLERWHDDGELGSVDLVVGDIFPAKFREEWSALLRLREGGVLKTLYTGKIHAKLILAEAASGERIVVESSANANMNPRCEQSVVSVSSELHEFYRSYFEVKFDEYVRKECSKEILKNEERNEKTDHSAGLTLFGEEW